MLCTGQEALRLMARTFGGVSTDAVVTGLSSHNTQRSYSIWAYRSGNGGANLGRLFDKRTGVDAEVETFFDNVGNEYTYGRVWSGANAQWKLGSGLPSLNAWHHLLLTYDATLASNAPVYYLDGVAQAVVTTVGASGTPNTNTSAYVVGNRTNDSARNWDGRLCEFAVWNCLLNLADAQRLANGRPANMIESEVGSLIAYYPIAGFYSPEPDSTALNAAATVTGTVLSAGPSWLTTLGPHPVYTNAA